MAEKMDAKLDYKNQQNEVVIDTNRKLRIGIIGCGWIAGAHLASYKNMPDVEIVAGCDLIPGKAAKFFKDGGVEGVKTDYASHKEMLDDESLKLDAVSVCTYNRQHAEPTIYALKKGVHVMLEKPFTVTLDEAVEVMKAEKESGKVLSIGFQPRLDANMQMIKKIVESGELGKVYYIQTGGGRRRGIPTPFGTTFIEDKTAGLGALADIGCYSLDMVLNAVGYPKPLTVTGYVSDYFGKNPEYWAAEGETIGKQMKSVSVMPYLMGTDAMWYLDGVETSEECDVAPYWFVRHGFADADTSYAVVASLFLAVEENAELSNLAFGWERNHNGGGNTYYQEFFQWLAEEGII